MRVGIHCFLILIQVFSSLPPSPQVLFHEVATPESKCLSLVVTDHLELQCETINSVDPKLLYIPPHGSRAAAKLPGPISKEYLRRIVEIVDSDMTLAGPAQ